MPSRFYMLTQNEGVRVGTVYYNDSLLHLELENFRDSTDRTARVIAIDMYVFAHMWAISIVHGTHAAASFNYYILCTGVVCTML